MRFFWFDSDSRNSRWSIARLKEYLRKKRGHSRLLFKKAELLEHQVSLNRHLACTLRCVYTPSAFPTTTTKKPTGTNFAGIATSSPCFLPASDSEWPQHLAQTTAGTNISLSCFSDGSCCYRFPYVYVLRTLTWDPCRRKENTDGTAPGGGGGGGKCLALLGFKELVMEESTCSTARA